MLRTSVNELFGVLGFRLKQAVPSRGIGHSVGLNRLAGGLLRLFGWLVIPKLLVVCVSAQVPSLDAAIATASAKTAPSNESHIDRHNALRRIDDLGSVAARSSLVLSGILSDKQDCEYCRRLAAHALGSISESALSEVPVLSRVLTDRTDHQGVRTDVARSLGRLGPMAKDGLGALVGVLTDARESSELRTVVAESIGQLGPIAAKSTVGALKEVAAFSGERDLKLTCIRALGRMGYQARSAIAMLATLLLGKTTDPGQFAVAADAFGMIAADLPNHQSELGGLELCWRILPKLHAVRNQLSNLRAAGDNITPDTSTLRLGEVIQQIDVSIAASEAELHRRPLCSFLIWLFDLRQRFKALIEGKLIEFAFWCVAIYGVILLPSSFIRHFFWGLFRPEKLKARRGRIEQWKPRVKFWPFAEPLKAPVGTCLSWLLGFPFADWAANSMRRLGFRTKVKSLSNPKTK